MRIVAASMGLVLCAMAVFGATLEFRLAPTGPSVDLVPLKGEFYVALTGAKGVGEPQLFIWNLQRNWSAAVVGPRREGGELIWGPIQLKRDCDPIREGMAATILADVGDMLVAAVDLAGAVTHAPAGPGGMPPGPSATARVAPPQAARHVLTLLDAEGNEVTELCCGAYTVRLEAPDLDISCGPEETTLTVISGEESMELALVETGGATGVFEATVRVGCELEGCGFAFSLGELTLSAGAKVGLVAGDTQLTVSVATLPVELAAAIPGAEPVTDLRVDVGQPFIVHIMRVKMYDEVRFCVDGNAAGSGRRIVLDTPGPHRITAFVRQGCRWGAAELVVTAVPRTAIEPMGFDPNSAPAQPMRFKLRHAVDDPAPVVYVGKIGKGCPREIRVERGEDGYTFSVDPAELGAGSGDVIWIYYEDPDFPADSTYLLVYLQ